MPELPEVEVTQRGISPFILKQTIQNVVIRQPQLRWLIPDDLAQHIVNKPVKKVERRGKFILLHVDTGAILLHLGMSGHLKILHSPIPAQKHDHLDIEFSHNLILRFTDPRRFGACLWIDSPVNQHQRLAKLGLEPFSADFNGAYLHKRAKSHRISIKSFIMNQEVVVGVGNIYAAEALFRSHLNPTRSANQIPHTQLHALALAIKQVLTEAIAQGGTTLRDFSQSNGKPGYFAVKLMVYGRSNQPCSVCNTLLKTIVLAQRKTVYCEHCQR